MQDKKLTTFVSSSGYLAFASKLIQSVASSKLRAELYFPWLWCLLSDSCTLKIGWSSGGD